MSKYKNKKVEYKGIKFSSIKEKDRYIILEHMQQIGEIKDLRLQVPFILQDEYTIDNKKVRPIKYICDFCYLKKIDGEIPAWIEVIEDVKASLKYKTEVYKLKKKIFEYKYGVKIKEVY